MADNNTKVYHVLKRASDNLWTVKIAGGSKVIKTFKTKAEAEEYVDKMAKNQNATVLTHASKGAKKGKITSGSKNPKATAEKKDASNK